jgi:type VI protein secretion system component VasK
MRQILGRTSRGQLWADELSTTTIAGAAPISLSSISSAAWLTSKEDLRVEAAYTKPGWDYVRKQIRCPGRPEQRYLAAGLVIDQNDCPTERAALQAQYFERYIKAWKRFLSDIYVREPEGYKEIEAQIVDMVTPGGPGVNALESLFGAVARNARLPLPADDTSEAPTDLIGGAIHRWRQRFIAEGIDLPGAEPRQGELPTVANVQQAFEPFYSYGSSPGGAATASPAPLTAYIQLLSKIPSSLGQYTKERSQEGLTQARTVALQIHELVQNEHLAQRDRHWTPTLEGILIPPVRGLLDAVNRDTLDELTMQWCNDIVYPFDEMRGCYPFSKGATCDVSGDEVANLFQPQSGKLWQLYVDKLQSRFPFQGDRYVPASQGYNSRVKLNPAVATFLTNARELSEVMFPGGAAAPSFAFAVQFKPLASASRITLQVDGVTVSYNNSDRDRFQAMTWPGTGGAPGAHLEATIQAGEADLDGPGYWGLFRLLEQGDVQRSGRLIVAKLRFHNVKQDAELRLDPQNGAGNPLFGKVRGQPEPGAAPEVGLMGIFRANRLSPPRQLFTTGSSCRPPNVPSPVPTP